VPATVKLKIIASGRRLRFANLSRTVRGEGID